MAFRHDDIEKFENAYDELISEQSETYKQVLQLMEEYGLTEEEAVIYLEEQMLKEAPEDEGDTDTWQSFQDTDPQVNDEDEEEEEDEEVELEEPEDAGVEENFPEKAAEETPQFEPKDEFETPETATDSEADTADADFTSDTSTEKSGDSSEGKQPGLSQKYPELYNLIGKFKSELSKVQDDNDMNDILDALFPDVKADVEVEGGEEMEEGDDVSEGGVRNLTDIDMGPIIDTDKGGGSE